MAVLIIVFILLVPAFVLGSKLVTEMKDDKASPDAGSKKISARSRALKSQASRKSAIFAVRNLQSSQDVGKAHV